MNRNILGFAAAAVCVLLLFALFRTGTHQGAGREVGGPRIVSLAPSVTEMVFAMGLEDLLVGVSDRCDYPPQAREIEAVGGFGAPSIERLLALQPDLAITTGIERKDLPALMEKSGVRFLDISVRDFETMFAAFRKIAEAAEAAERGEETVSRLRSELGAVAQRFADVPREGRPSVFVEIWHDPIMTAGGPSFLTDVIERAGGVNAAESVGQEYPTINAEQVLDWDPDFILLGYMNEGDSAAAQIGRRIGWSRLKAVEKGGIIGDIHPDLLLRPGPRLVDGVRQLAGRLWPEGAEGGAAAP